MLSPGESGSLSQHAADNKIVYDLQELRLLPAPCFTKKEAVPRGVQFPIRHSPGPILFLSWENWFCPVTARYSLLSQEDEQLASCGLQRRRPTAGPLAVFSWTVSPGSSALLHSSRMREEPSPPGQQGGSLDQRLHSVETKPVTLDRSDGGGPLNS